MEIQQFIKEINTLRLTNKNKWYNYIGRINGKLVSIKGFNTWLQIFRVDGLDYSNGMGAKVGEFKKSLSAPFE